MCMTADIVIRSYIVISSYNQVLHAVRHICIGHFYNKVRSITIFSIKRFYVLQFLLGAHGFCLNSHALSSDFPSS